MQNIQIRQVKVSIQYIQMSGNKKQNIYLDIATSKSQSQINKLKYGIQYATEVLRLFSQIEGIFEKVQTNENFQINDILFSKKVDEKIIKNLLQEYQSQKNNSDDQNNLNIFKDWNFQNQGQNQKRDILVTQLLEYFKDFIQKGKEKPGEIQNDKKKEKKFETVQGDFDIIFGEKNLKANKEIIYFLKTKAQHKTWVQQDYLKVESILQRNEDDDAKYIFQIKRNPFRKQRQTKQKDKEMEKTIENWIQRNNINTENKDLKQKENPTFKQIFQNRLLNNNMIENISQIIKLLYASIHLHYAKEQQNLTLSYYQYLRMRNKRQYTYVKKIKSSHPVIVVYYILNSNITKQSFKEKFDFFLPLLRHIFIQNKAILNVVGYNPLNPIEAIKKQFQTKLKEMQKLEAKLMEKEKLEAKLMKMQKLEAKLMEMQKIEAKMEKEKLEAKLEKEKLEAKLEKEKLEAKLEKEKLEAKLMKMQKLEENFADLTKRFNDLEQKNKKNVS